MNEIIKKDILEVLNDLIKILKSKEGSNWIGIKELSNHVIHNASVFQDEDSISVAVLTYALSKIMERNQNMDSGRVLKFLTAAIDALEKESRGEADTDAA